MGLIISSVNQNSKNVSFGMAKFTNRGLELAKSCSDIYQKLDTPNVFKNGDFFKSYIFTSPFEKFVKRNNKTSAGIKEIADTIEICGATQNSHTNAKFIKQLLSSKKTISKINDDDQRIIAGAIKEVFNNNWDNPEISKKNTYKLLDMCQKAIQDKEYTTLSGVIQKSDIKK